MNSAARRTPEPSDRFDASLGRYALAATATLAAATSADAAITNFYDTGSFTLTGSFTGYYNYQNFEFSEAGISIDFWGSRSSSSDPSTFLGAIGAYGAANVRLLKVPSTALAINFAPDADITGEFGERYAIFFGTHSFEAEGNFSPSTGGTRQGYLGFRADLGGVMHVGWLRLELSRDANGRPAQLSLAAIDGIVGAFAPEAEGIAAGQVAPVPEPAAAATGLGLLALGAAGLRRRRALLAGRN